MSDFVLDPRLRNDCIELGVTGKCRLLLLNNSLYPWFILVPETDKTELIDLPFDTQTSILKIINDLGRFVKESFSVTKLNIGAIGNVVSQLHIHIIGRHPDDNRWPDVVWGTRQKEIYASEEIDVIQKRLLESGILQEK